MPVLGKEHNTLEVRTSQTIVSSADKVSAGVLCLVLVIILNAQIEEHSEESNHDDKVFGMRDTCEKTERTRLYSAQRKED